ncbi:MAG TPA: hypothetical protein VJP76_07345 [Candidatus Tumulicola sp.]|nr:hypothetical protein [Candidatus Tumulicola sp.]
MKYKIFSARQQKQDDGAPGKTTYDGHLRANIRTILDESIGSFYDGHIGIGNEPVETTDIWIEFDRVLAPRIQGILRVRRREKL